MEAVKRQQSATNGNVLSKKSEIWLTPTNTKKEKDKPNKTR